MIPNERELKNVVKVSYVELINSLLNAKHIQRYIQRCIHDTSNIRDTLAGNNTPLIQLVKSFVVKWRVTVPAGSVTTLTTRAAADT